MDAAPILFDRRLARARLARAQREARPGADFLVANDVSRSDIAFGSGDNEVTVYRREGEPVFLARRPKGELAASLFDLFAATLSTSEHLSAASPL